MNELMNPMNMLNINSNSNFPVNGRELHERLRIGTAYKDWFPRMREYGFEEGKDFCSKMSESTGGRPSMDHSLTISMAKELCMLQRTEAGRMVRRYLIRVEEAWNTPDAIMARALSLANERMKALTGEVLQLQAVNSELTVQKQIMQPKADYFDELVDRNLLTSFRDTAKQLRVKQKTFVGFLLEHKYIYRDKKGNLMPYAQHVDKGLFEMKECFNDKSRWAGTQTLITPKGRETFRLLMVGAT